MDTDAVLYSENPTPEMGAGTMTLDPAGQKLYTAEIGISAARICRYSVAGDVMVLEQDGYSACDGKAIEVSPDGKHLVYPAGGGNGSGYNIHDYSAADLNRVFGVWEVGAYPLRAKWSPDGGAFFGLQDDCIHVMDAANYRLFRRLVFPNAHYYGVFAPNADGTAIVGFSYNTYCKNGHALYFFDDVLPPATPAQKEPLALGTISDVVAVADPAYVYATDKDNQALYKIDVAAEKIVKRYGLPFTQPVAMDYSSVDNALFIVSRYSGEVIVWDIATETWSTFTFSETGQGSDVAVDGARRRVYVLDRTGTFHVLNAATGAVITRQGQFPGPSFALNAGEQKVIATTNGVSPGTACRYSVADDTVSLEQTATVGSGTDDFIAISPDGQQAVYSYPLKSFSPWDLEHQVAQWNASRRGAFSPDGRVFLGVAGTNTLAMMGAASGQLYRNLDFPNGGDYARLCVTADSSAAVAFSYNGYYNNQRALYFYHNILQPVPPGPDTPFAIGKLAEITAVSNPDCAYAIDQDRQALYKIDINAQSITKHYDLPFPQPVSMAYSAPDDALYILSRFSTEVVVWDVAAEGFKKYPLPDNRNGQAVQVDPIHRRIYVLADNGAFIILDEDTGTLLDLENPVPHTDSNTLAMDPVQQKLFTADGNVTPSSLYRYSVAGDRLALEQQVGGISFANTLALSPNGISLALPGGDSVLDYSAANLTVLLGTWYAGVWVSLTRWTPDGRVMLAGNRDSYDNSLYVMDGSTHQRYRTLAFPNSSSYSRFAANADGSAAVGFSYDAYGNTAHALYFFYDVQPSVWLKRR